MRGGGVGHIPDKVYIHQRPERVEGRQGFGRFKMNLIQNGKDFILTIAERKARFPLMERLTDGKNADGKAVIRLLKPFKRHVLSITTDNGGEFARHKRVTETLNAPVFFTAPYASWRKGTVENTDKLIRQHIDKQMNISNITYNKLLTIQNKSNYRPRKVIAFNQPAAPFITYMSNL